MDILSIIISILFGIISLVLTAYYGKKGHRRLDILMSNFDQKVMDVLIKRLEKGRLSNAQQVRGITKNVSVEYGINMPSDENTVRVLRRIALKYEQCGDNSESELSTLEYIRKEMEPKGPPLMSIASINRLTAFQIIMGVSILALIVYQLFHLENPSADGWMPHILIFVLEFLIVAIMYVINTHSKDLLDKQQK